MKRTRLLLVALIFVSFLIAMSANRNVSARSKEIVVVKGAGAMAALVDSLAKDFMQANPKYYIVVSGGRSWKGLKYLLDGSAQVAMCLRPITATDRNQVKGKGMDLIARVIDWDGVAVITHPDNPVNRLSLDQLKDLFTGKYRSWKAVEGPDAPVRVIVAEAGKSWVAWYFADEVMKGSRPAASATVRRYFKSIVREVQTTPWTIGYAPVERVEKMRTRYPVKVLAISRTVNHLAVAASKKTVEDRSYLLIRPYVLVYDGNSNRKGPKEFAEYCSRIRLKRR